MNTNTGGQMRVLYSTTLLASTNCALSAINAEPD